MLILMLALAWTDPAAVAVATCQALPGIAIRPDDRALFQPLLTAKDLGVLDKAKPTHGLKRVDAATLAQLRSQTTCVAEETNGAGSGQWAVKLTRTAPTITGDGAVGPVTEQTFEWQVTDEKSGRVDLNLTGAAIARRNADEAIGEQDWKRYASSWRALAQRWLDPLLAVDIADAEALQDRMEYSEKLEQTFDKASDGLVQATVENTGDRAVKSLVVDATFESGKTPLHSQTTLGAVPAGGKLNYTLEIPEGAEGKVALHTTDLSFAP
ncbi:MAG: hypothetical protein GXP62_13795 [Oligoflexia bacterium]|nr:hypothetical protein [Oligoflexia bacterium]